MSNSSYHHDVYSTSRDPIGRNSSLSDGDLAYANTDSPPSSEHSAIYSVYQKFEGFVSVTVFILTSLITAFAWWGFQTIEKMKSSVHKDCNWPDDFTYGIEISETIFLTVGIVGSIAWALMVPKMFSELMNFLGGGRKG